jgi:PAS domain-containing protein
MITSFVVNFLVRRVRAEQRDQMRAQEALRESERSARSTIDGIAGLIAIMAPNGKVETVNRQVLEYFGRSLEELKNWETSDAVHPEDLPHVVKGFTKAWQPEFPTTTTNACGASTVNIDGLTTAASQFAMTPGASRAGAF